MNYDFFAEFWDEEALMEKFNKIFREKWDNIERNVRMKWKEKPKKLSDILKNETMFFDTVINEFLGSSNSLCPTLYQKTQKVLQEFILVNTHNLKDQIHEILEHNLRNYERNKSNNPVNNLDLSENPKKAYEKLIHPNVDKWLEFPKEVFDLMERLNVKFKENEIPDLSFLPSYSFFLSIIFTLRKPFISKDDEEFYIHENPISKEKVFKVPYVRASSWKGNLRWVAYKKLIDRLHSMTEEEKKKEKSMLMHERLALARIFGNEKDIVETYLKGLFGELNEEYERELREIYGKKEDEEVNFQGRLHFYPTFFNMIGLDVINPHDRETRAGTKPIILEVVPETAEGTFSLLYAPFDLIENETEFKKQFLEDLKIIYKVILDILETYGFSAKKSSGYGVVNTEFKRGLFTVKEISKPSEFKDCAGLDTVFQSVIKKLEEI